MLSREINDSANPRDTPCFKNGKRANKNRNATAEAKCREYLDSVLGHLTRKERAVMEPVRRHYRHVFHDKDEAEFKGTDLVEHRIITGDAKPIRKAQYRVPYALRDERKAKLGTCFRRESLNLVLLPGMLRPSLSLRNQLTAGLSIVSVLTSVL